ncbi:MAG TPA: hypothetical protein VFH63_04970 [candidate division Zixibacteria bacterium]|nr:hypothetical protein [candidate division Zixibacteria bacterium]
MRGPIRRAWSLLVATLLTVAIGAPALAAGDHFNIKFEFEDVTFPDGSGGEIYASSKRNNRGDAFTYCGYVGADQQFMGTFGSGEFSSPVADEVLQFCLDNFANRSL